MVWIKEAISMKIMQIFTETFLNLSMQTVWVITWMSLLPAVDVIFTATPQGFLAGVLNEDILNKVKIIDLSADFRIKDVATYEKMV